MSALAVALALCALLPRAQDESDSGRSPAGIPAIVHPSLARDPRTLPRAEEGRWADWRPKQAPPEAIRDEWAAATRSYMSGDLANALGAMLDLLEREPEYPPLLHQTGVLYFKLRRYGDAAEMFERYLRISPDLVSHTRGLGHCYYSLGEYERAAAHYARLLEQSPGDVEARRGLALSSLRLGDRERALRELLAVVERAPDHADAWTWIAQLRFDDGDAEAALDAVLRARDLAPFEPRPWFLAAQVLFDLGRDEEAKIAEARHAELDRATQQIRQLETRLALDPDQRSDWAELARLHASIGDRASARRAWSRLAETAPSDVGLQLGVLEALLESGDGAGAASFAPRVEALAGSDADVWARLERVYAALEDRVGQARAGERWLRLR